MLPRFVSTAATPAWGQKSGLLLPCQSMLVGSPARLAYFFAAPELPAGPFGPLVGGVTKFALGPDPIEEGRAPNLPESGPASEGLSANARSSCFPMCHVPVVPELPAVPFGPTVGGLIARFGRGCAPRSSSGLSVGRDAVRPGSLSSPITRDCAAPELPAGPVGPIVGGFTAGEFGFAPV
jgi:hypothetical protein